MYDRVFLYSQVLRSKPTSLSTLASPESKRQRDIYAAAPPALSHREGADHHAGAEARELEAEQDGGLARLVPAKP